MFSIGDTKCLSALLLFPENLSDHLPTRVFIQQTLNLDTTCFSKISRGTFFKFSKYRILILFLALFLGLFVIYMQCICVSRFWKSYPGIIL